MQAWTPTVKQTDLTVTVTFSYLDVCAQGQESRKVTDLSDAMRDAGLDPDAIIAPIEEEYALMDMPQDGEAGEV